MFRKMIAGASALAIGALVATGALAGGSSGGLYSQTASAVSVQTLSATSVGPTVDVDLVPIVSGNATLMGSQQQFAVGVVQASANTGASAIVQQASSIAAATVLNFSD